MRILDLSYVPYRLTYNFFNFYAGVFLAVTDLAVVVFPSFILERDDLRAFDLSYDLSNDGGICNVRGTHFRSFSVIEKKDVFKLDLIAFPRLK